jgi:hypothetical protein
MLEQRLLSPGFVYTWSELSTGKIYCGSHKGYPNDGYICSSKTLLPKIKENPNNYVRKIEAMCTWGEALVLEKAINRMLLKNLDTTHNRTAGKAIVNAVHPMLGKQHSDGSKIKQRNKKLGLYDGAKHPQFKGHIIATNVVTGEIQKFAGNVELANAGFQFQNVSHCINGKRKTHKGHTFRREN